MKYIKTFEQFVNESTEVNESRSITAVSQELDKTGKEMKSLVDKWKREKDEKKKDELKIKLKELTTKKKDLMGELQDAVEKLDKEAELEVSESTEELYEKEFSQEKRDELAKKGFALPDGSYPIENKKDLENAIKAFGRAKDPSKAKTHIKKRAKELGNEDLIPSNW